MTGGSIPSVPALLTTGYTIPISTLQKHRGLLEKINEGGKPPFKFRDAQERADRIELYRLIKEEIEMALEDGKRFK